MSEKSFIIHYKTIKNLEFSTANAARKYIESEATLWAEFFEHSSKTNLFDGMQSRWRPIAKSELFEVYDQLLAKIESPRQFGEYTSGGSSARALPPPSEEVEGQLILGLFHNGRNYDALAAYIYFVNHTLSIRIDNNHDLQRLMDRGEKITLAGYASAALPFGKVSSQKLASTIGAAKSHVAALNEEVKVTQGVNSEHEKKLSRFRKLLISRVRRLRKVSFAVERSRKASHDSWMKEIDEQVKQRFARAETRLDAVDRLNSQRQSKREEDFNRLLNLFHTQLRLRAPVKLWEERASQHDKRASSAIKYFFVLTLIAIFSGALLPYLFGDYIASSFFVISCDSSEPPVCQQIFSAKGPLTISRILVIFSLFLWMIRLQYRVYLSERHLSLDASEKKAFAETFLAMQEGQSVGAGNEAIVLASLFRPTQDGIINDNDTGIDLSAAAILAKHLGRP